MPGALRRGMSAPLARRDRRVCAWLDALPVAVDQPEGGTMKATLTYVRYVVSALASIGFEVAMN